jgi:AraC-like DNA-binding protein
MERAKLTSSSAKTQVDIWSTDAVGTCERFSYWREAVCQAVFNISIEALPEPFSARITSRSCGPLRFSTSESTGYELIRSRRDIASAPADHYTVFLQLSGRTVIAQGDATVAFHGGDIAVFDGRQPFRAVFSDAARRVTAVVPRAMIERRAPWLRNCRPRRLAADSKFIDLTWHHMLQLSSDHATLSESATSLLADNLCNLVALASAADIAPNRLQGELQIEALLAFCRQNLHDAELSPQRVADSLGISVRTLHSRFRKIDQTFGRWLLDNRLEACRTALRDENQQPLKISDVAYRWGFNDLSYFNKTFRARFDMSPREWRNANHLHAASDRHRVAAPRHRTPRPFAVDRAAAPGLARTLRRHVPPFPE